MKPAIGMKERLAIARSSVEMAAGYFRARGFNVFDVRDPSANGQDMTVAKGGRAYRVEVKTISRSSGVCSVKAVGNPRKTDDFIAMVLGPLVIVQPMRDHLAACAPSGIRHVTELVALAGLTSNMEAITS